MCHCDCLLVFVILVGEAKGKRAALSFYFYLSCLFIHYGKGSCLFNFCCCCCSCYMHVIKGLHVGDVCNTFCRANLSMQKIHAKGLFASVHFTTFSSGSYLQLWVIQIKFSAVCHHGALPCPRVANQSQKAGGLIFTSDVLVYRLHLLIPTQQYLNAKQRMNEE